MPSLGRLLVIHALIVVLAGGSLASIAFDQEAWPISNFPMYSYPLAGRRTLYRFYGVVDGVEVALMDRDYWIPLGPQRIARALFYFDRRGGQPDRVPHVLAWLARAYEEDRTRGTHHGPRISSLRVYELTWTIRSGAVNRDTPTARRLVAEQGVDALR